MSRKFGFHRRRLKIIYVFGEVHKCACKVLAHCHVYNIIPWHHSETHPAGELLEFPKLLQSHKKHFPRIFQVLMHFWKQFSLGQNFSPKTNPKLNTQQTFKNSSRASMKSFNCNFVFLSVSNLFFSRLISLVTGTERKTKNLFDLLLVPKSSSHLNARL